MNQRISNVSIYVWISCAPQLVEEAALAAGRRAGAGYARVQRASFRSVGSCWKWDQL